LPHPKFEDVDPAEDELIGVLVVKDKQFKD
jgi:hypothetical protein